MTIIIGSARRNEQGSYSVGQTGDQLQTSNIDYKGEVSLQNYYMHKKGWILFRPISPIHADKFARLMYDACNNPKIGYSQNERGKIWKDGIYTTTPTNCDCSSLVRQVIKEGIGLDIGNFNTTSEPKALKKSGLFEKEVNVTDDTILCDGDILVTPVQGHTVIVVSGNPRSVVKYDYFPKCDSRHTSVIDALKSIGADSSMEYRSKIAKMNNITNEFSGQPTYNKVMLQMLKNGTLRKP